MGADQLYKVAYDEAVRALSEQQRVIDSIHTRTGLLLSAAAITTSFLGAQALNSGDAGLFSWLALAGFVGVAAASLAILWPRKWQIATNPSNVIATYIESTESISIEELHRELSLHMRGSWAENREGEAQLVVLFQGASVLLAVELVLWAIAIATNASGG